MEVRVRATPTVQAPVVSEPSLGGQEPERPRRRPMVEVAGPRRAPVQRVPTITVDIPVEPETAPAVPPPTPVTPVTPVAPVNIDVPWYAEDIERLPEANVDLEQLSLESFETLPPMPLRLDVPQSSRTGTVPSR